jgi:glycosyltransferase involved in cell wall biosynthesis
MSTMPPGRPQKPFPLSGNEGPAASCLRRTEKVTVSLIITTYNWKEALELSLLSALEQNQPADEIIIADDGSREDTRDLVCRIAEDYRVPLCHLWQRDKGFRAARIRNKAITKAKGEYLIFIDGDILLHKAFIKDHQEAARPLFFSQGSRVLLTPNKSAQVLREKQRNFSFFEPGLKNRKNAIHSGLLSKLVRRKSLHLTGIRTCNFAFWRADGIAVNGFNEDFEGWGREDSEFAARLMSSGVQRQTLRFSALTFHLFHPANPRDFLERNDRLLENTVRTQSTWCINGLDKHLQLNRNSHHRSE